MDAERSLCHPSEPSSRARSKRRSPLPRLHWLLVAVGLCWLSWPAPAEAQPACVHDVCEVGDNLNFNCVRFPGDTCVDDICNGTPATGAGDPYCCDVEWDDNCVSHVLTICEDPICEQVCSHSPCEIGDPLDSTCNACTALVCFLDPNCCDVAGAWDASCVNKVQNECVIQCEPGANICSNALPIHPGTILGTLLGASNDGCDGGVPGEPGGVSCNSPDVWYEYTQGAADTMVAETCSTQRGYAIDTVLSIHEGATVQDRCPGKKSNRLVTNDDWRLGSAPQACDGFGDPNNVDAGVSFSIAPGETVVFRIAHHPDSIRNNFQLRILPEPEAWLALVAGAGALGALSRRRARG